MGRWESLRAIYEQHGEAEGKGKQVILSEFCANGDYQGKCAIRLLNGPWPQAKDLPLKRNMIKLSVEENSVFARATFGGASKAAASLEGNAYQGPQGER
jgi:hypothetical protein